MAANKIVNFSPGPSKLPEDVLKTVQDELLNYGGTGISILEMSHRSQEFLKIVTTAQDSVRHLLNIPFSYEILFMAGGGTGQFAAIPLNLMQRTGKAAYLVTGTWSSKAAKEAAKYGNISEIKPDLDSISQETNWSLEEDVSYLYYCANETVEGVELNFLPHIPNNVPLVADMSSNILTQDIDVMKFGLIFAGAQKNIGPAGVTLVIVRQDLLGNALTQCPAVFNYSYMAKEKSLHNTPPCFSLYVMGLVFEWITNQGGVKNMEQRSKAKSQMVYDMIDGSNGFYFSPTPVHVRSRVNIVFRIRGGDEKSEKQFVDQAKKRNMIQLKGHRSFGGIRASLYNAITVDEVRLLVQFMNEFMNSGTALNC